MKKSVAVVVPIYRDILDWYEQIAISQLKSVLGRYDVHVVAPPMIDTVWIQSILPGCSVHVMAPWFFRSPYHYTFMMLGEGFYQQFGDYDHILIHQTDAFVFRDELMEWVKTGYSYIGAPWRIRSHAAQRDKWLVGNGGFSLRNVAKTIDVLRTARAFASRKAFGPIPFGVPGGLGTLVLKLGLLGTRGTGWGPRDVPFLMNWFSQEDVFFGLIAPKLLSSFTVCEPELAIRFSFDAEPRYFYGENLGQLPFGCHGWQKNDPQFWDEFIPRGASHD